MPKMRRDHLPNRRKVIWVGSEELQSAVAERGHITVLRCGNIHEVINPYWVLPWPSLEQSGLDPEMVNDHFGGPPGGRLLASILGHALALDLYGPRSKAGAA